MSRKYANPGPPTDSSAQNSPPSGQAEGAGGAVAQPPAAALPDFERMSLAEIADLTDPATSGNTDDPRTLFYGPQAGRQPAPAPKQAEAAEKKPTPEPQKPENMGEGGVREVRLRDGSTVRVAEDDVERISAAVDEAKQWQGRYDQQTAAINRLQRQLDQLSAAPAPQNQVTATQQMAAIPAHSADMEAALATIDKIDRENQFGGELSGAMKKLVSSVEARFMDRAKDEVFTPASEVLAGYKTQQEKIQEYMSGIEREKTVARVIEGAIERRPYLKDFLNPAAVSTRVAAMDQFARENGVAYSQNEMILAAINDEMAEAMAPEQTKSVKSATQEVIENIQRDAGGARPGRTYSDRGINTGSLASNDAEQRLAPRNGSSNGRKRIGDLLEPVRAGG